MIRFEGFYQRPITYGRPRMFYPSLSPEDIQELRQSSSQTEPSPESFSGQEELHDIHHSQQQLALPQIPNQDINPDEHQHNKRATQKDVEYTHFDQVCSFSFYYIDASIKPSRGLLFDRKLLM